MNKKCVNSFINDALGDQLNSKKVSHSQRLGHRLMCTRNLFEITIGYVS